MRVKPVTDLTFTHEVRYVLVAAFAGIVRFALRIEYGESLSARLFLAHVVVSGFSGWMLKLFTTATNVVRAQEDLLLLTSGIGGFLGGRALHWVAGQILISKGGKNGQQTAQGNESSRDTR